MAKYRKRRFRRRKATWSSNIEEINLSGTATANSSFGDNYIIAQNPPQNNNSVSSTFTVKNVEISAYLESLENYANIENIVYYIMYVPEGYGIDINLPKKHPEWVLAYKFIGQGSAASQATNTQPPRIKTRLARKLNTGDSIIFLFTARNNNATNTEIKWTGLVRWWTKAN